MIDIFKKMNELGGFSMDGSKEEKTQPDRKAADGAKGESPSNVLQRHPPSSLSNLRAMPLRLSAGRATVPSSEAEGDMLGEHSK